MTDPLYATLVSADELTDFMGSVSLDGSQERSAALVLAGVQEELETYLNRPVQPMRVRQVVVTDNNGYANLAVTPVWDVVQVVGIEGATRGTPYVNVALTPYVPVEGERATDYIKKNFTSGTAITAGGFYIGYPQSWYEVEYIAGYNGSANNALKLAILRVAARDMTNNTDDTVGLQNGNVTAPVSSDVRATGWTMEELQKFDRMRRRVIA